MKKIFAAAIFAGMFFGMTAYADVLPPGQKMVPVCAFFSNTAAMLDTVAVFGYDTEPGGARLDLSRFIADECFKPGYKFNNYQVFGLTPEHAAQIDEATYDPTTDSEAYPSNIQVEAGYTYVPEDSTLTEIRNQYRIVKLDTANKVLVIEPERELQYYAGITDPVVITGKIFDFTDASKNDISGDNSPSVDIFSDVSPDSPYYEALLYLKAQGIVKGYEDGSFKLDNTINRAELMKIIVAAAYDEATVTDCAAYYTKQSDYNVTLFTDVVFAMVGGNVPPWYFDYVCVGKHEGFVGGYPDGSFKPGNQINFVEAAKIITKRADMNLVEGTPWYKVYVDALDNANAIPTTITSFDQKITRGEMAEIIYRLTAKVTDKASQSYSDLK
jgi:hypothetical protein